MHYVSFIDILGYRELVDNYFTKESELLTKLVTILNEAYELHKVLLIDLNVEILFISDSLFIFCNAEDDLKYLKLLDLIGFISVFQSICLLHNIYVRGGLSKGNHLFHKGNVPNMNIVVSQALIDSVEIEKKATYPKIIVTDSLIEESLKVNYGIYPFIVHENNNHFIDYYSGLISICFNKTRIQTILHHSLLNTSLGVS